jgi:hypothetical protein
VIHWPLALQVCRQNSAEIDFYVPPTTPTLMSRVRYLPQSGRSRSTISDDSRRASMLNLRYLELGQCATWMKGSTDTAFYQRILPNCHDFWQTGWVPVAAGLARLGRRGSEERHWKSGPSSGSLAPRYRVSDIRYRLYHSISNNTISNAHSMISTFFTFDIVYRLGYRRCSISNVTHLDIEGDILSISKVTKMTVE